MSVVDVVLAAVCSAGGGTLVAVLEERRARCRATVAQLDHERRAGVLVDLAEAVWKQRQALLESLPPPVRQRTPPASDETS